MNSEIVDASWNSVKEARSRQLSTRLQNSFEEFHKRNPNVYRMLVEMSRQVKSKGRAKYSINSLFERVRWHYLFERDVKETFKLSNNYRSRYARMIMECCPDLAGFFNLRPLRS